MLNNRIGPLAVLPLYAFMWACGSGDAGPVEPEDPPAPIASLELERGAVTVAMMQDFELVAVARDAAGTILTGRPIRWTSSDSAVVTVGDDGTVIGRQRGSATVVATAEGKSAAAEIRVVVLTSVTAGVDETCAISEDGRLYCAGARYGPRARLISTELRFRAVALGANNTAFSCAITTDDQLFCWGDNAFGQLGVGDALPREQPTPVSGSLRFKSAALGRGHTCAITTDGQAYCWGRGTSGQLGAGEFTGSSTPVKVAGELTFAEVTAGRWYSCGLVADGSVYCWGENEAGHLGRGSGPSSAAPQPISGDHLFSTITGGGAACGVTPAGRAYCWGDNTLYKLGAITSETCFGDKPCSTVPVRVMGNNLYASISSSNFGTCALARNGTVYCWGMNIDGKFGATIPPGCDIPNAPAPCTPTPTAGPTGMRTLSTGPTTACGMHANGGAYCWGGNGAGQLGRPGLAMSELPVPFGLDPDTEG